jgi:hypothetical protein
MIFPDIHGVEWEDKIKNFEFNITRKPNDHELDKLRQKFHQLLIDIGNDIDKLLSIKQIIVRTRNISYGKGEQLLSYMMIFELYLFFPSEAARLFDEFLLTHGSWRDVPYLSSYIFKTTSNTDHPFIRIAIRKMNEQLSIDLISLNKGEKISNAAKWVPREKSKFFWIFDKLAEDWAIVHSPYLFRSPKTAQQFVRAKNKSRYLYRKVFTTLSRSLNIIETDLCNKVKFEDIPIRNITTGSVLKYWNSNINMNIASKTYPLSWMIQQAKGVDLSNENVIHQLNNLWNYRFRNAKKVQTIIPVIDLSYLMDNSIHNAIGIALSILERSFFQDSISRLLFVGNEPIWFKCSSDFVSTVKNIFNILPPFTNGNILSGISLLSKSFVFSELSPSEISIVILSNGRPLHDEIETLFHNTYPNISYVNV